MSKSASKCGTIEMVIFKVCKVCRFLSDFNIHKIFSLTICHTAAILTNDEDLPAGEFQKPC